MNNLTLIIPAKNESLSLPSVLKNLEKFNIKIIISLKENDSETINSIKNFKYKYFFPKRKRIWKLT